ncbi:MAG: AAA family ATPase, partial [Gemmatimonadota bacterium]
IEPAALPTDGDRAERAAPDERVERATTSHAPMIAGADGGVRAVCTKVCTFDPFRQQPRTTPMTNDSTTIAERIRVHLAARCPLLYLVSWEEDRVLDRVEQVAEPLFDEIYEWSITEGLRERGGKPLDGAHEGPYGCLEYIGANAKRALFVLRDFHPYLSEAKVIRKMRDVVHDLQAASSSIVIVSPKEEIPLELEKDLTIVDFPLPTLDDMRALFTHIEEGIRANPSLEIELTAEERERLLQAAVGLTENEAKNVFAKAIAADRRLTASDIDYILDEKRQIVRKSGILEYFPTPATFATVGGMDRLKDWLRVRADALSSRARDFRLPPPRGLLLTGVPGCGKSLMAKAVAREWRQPLLRLDVGKIFEGLVGSSEANVRRTIQFAEAVAPCVLWIDEIEKGFAGVRSTGDSGTSARVFSTFLTWLQEKTSPVFVVATANDVSALPPEMLRRGRFDELFFIDLPFEAERREILRIHIEKRGRDPDALGLDLPALTQPSEGFSGAELEQAVVAALYKAFAAGRELATDFLAEALEEMIPLSETMREPLAAMRSWARHRARYASSLRRDEEGKPVQVERWANIG